MNKTADILPKFETDYMFIRTVAESKIQPCITFVETRSGVVISFMCARKGGCQDLTKEILRHLKLTVSSDPLTFQCDKEMSVIDVWKSCTRTKRENSVTICAKNMSSEERVCRSTRHKSRRTLAYSFQQFHLPFHMRFVTLDLFSQDSQCDPTAEPIPTFAWNSTCVNFVHVW